MDLSLRWAAEDSGCFKRCFRIESWFELDRIAQKQNSDLDLDLWANALTSDGYLLQLGAVSLV